jgi:hypothetical protein
MKSGILGGITGLIAGVGLAVVYPAIICLFKGHLFHDSEGRRYNYCLRCGRSLPPDSMRKCIIAPSRMGNAAD